jgi:hypothetical protein
MTSYALLVTEDLLTQRSMLRTNARHAIRRQRSTIQEKTTMYRTMGSIVIISRVTTTLHLNRMEIVLKDRSSKGEGVSM